MPTIISIILLIFQLAALVYSIYICIKCYIETREYTYLISYFHKNGNGCVCIVRDRKIDNWDEIRTVSKFIEQENHLENVVIINYRRLKK